MMVHVTWYMFWNGSVCDWLGNGLLGIPLGGKGHVVY